MILVNGKETGTIDVRDRGLQYGDGLFETIAVQGGRPRFWQAHMDRLAKGCERLVLPLPDTDLLAEEAGRALRGRSRAVLKILLSRGPGGRGYRVPENVSTSRILSVSAAPEYPDYFYGTGINVRLCRTRLGHNPDLAGIKHLNRLEQVLARSEWCDGDVPEGLMLDVEGYVAEGTMSNVFVRHGNRLRTPPVERCGVAGIMRNWVLGHSTGLGLDIEVAPVTLEAVHQADELFVTNAVIGIWPVRRFEGKLFAQISAARRLNRLLTEECDA